jgi:hypothetical protein
VDSFGRFFCLALKRLVEALSVSMATVGRSRMTEQIDSTSNAFIYWYDTVGSGFLEISLAQRHSGGTAAIGKRKGRNWKANGRLLTNYLLGISYT